MTRINDLQRKYPAIPREVIIKCEVMVRGIRDSEVLSRTGSWYPTSELYYRDHDVTLKELTQKTPAIITDGYVLRPGPLFMRHGIGARIERDSTSPYLIRESGSNRFALYEREEKVEDVFFPLAHPDFNPDRSRTSQGTLVSTLIDNSPVNSPVCTRAVPVRHCEYFSRGEQCKFCNLDPSHEVARAVGVEDAISNNLTEIVEAYKIRSSQRRIAEVRFVMGGFAKSEQEARTYLTLVEGIASGASYKPNLVVVTQPMERKNVQRLRDMGLDSLIYDMEVWDPEIFAEVCPGKAKYTGHERYKEAFLEAVSVFGVGNVGCIFVTGATLLASNGHKTWQEARDSMAEGNRWMIDNGVHSMCMALRWAPGSVFSQDPANRAKLPPTELILELGLAHHEAMMEHGRYEKLNKFLACPMCCLVPYWGEIGVLTLAGDVGNWLADVVPEKANWIAKFIASLGLSAEPVGG